MVARASSADFADVGACILQQLRGSDPHAAGDRRLRDLKEVRVAIRNPQTFVGGGPNFDIDFALLGPDLMTLWRYAEQLRERGPELGLLDADTTLRIDKPELRVQIDDAEERLVLVLQLDEVDEGAEVVADV